MTDRVKFDEGLVDPITAALLTKARAILSTESIRLWCAEGYSLAPEHAGTHAGDGAFDLHGSSRTWEQCVRTAEVLRDLGCAAWPRDADHGGMTQHVHAIVIDHPGLSDAARRQVGAYLAGFNGMGSGGFRGGPDYLAHRPIAARWEGLPKMTARMAAAGVVTGWTHRVKVTPPDVLNVRSEPSATGRKIDSLENWALVQVLERRGSWARIKGDHGETGWVSAAYLEGITK